MHRIISAPVLCSLCQCAGIEREAEGVSSVSSGWSGEYWAGQMDSSFLSINLDGTYETRHRSCAYSATWGQGEWFEVDGRYCQKNINGVKVLVPTRFVGKELPAEELILLGFVCGDIETVQKLQNDAMKKLMPRLRELILPITVCEEVFSPNPTYEEDR